MTILSALDRRIRSHGSKPLLTYYHLGRGERIEFNAVSFGNWVDKTANLLDELDLAQLIELDLTKTNPAHWVTLIWPLAIWRAGREIADGSTHPIVVGPRTSPIAGRLTIACSLDPFARGLTDANGVIDFVRETLAQPDGYIGLAEPSPGPEKVAEITGRILVTHGDIFTQAIAGPLLGGGSSVVIDGPYQPADLSRISTAERVSDQVAIIKPSIKPIRF